MGRCRHQIPIPMARNCFASHPLSKPFSFYRSENFPVSARFFPFFPPGCIDMMITVANTGRDRPASFGKIFFIDDVLPAVMTLGRVVFLGILGVVSIWL